MMVLYRNNGTPFVLQPYRELFELKNPGLFRREIQLAAQNYGQYVRIYKKTGAQYEAIFARDQGYLFGETVWEYFGKPQNLLYCEPAPNELGQALIVVVRNGVVYLDAKIPYQQVVAELIFLQIGNDKFAVYVYGDVPINDSVNKDKFVLNPERVQSFTRLN